MKDVNCLTRYIYSNLCPSWQLHVKDGKLTCWYFLYRDFLLVMYVCECGGSSASILPRMNEDARIEHWVDVGAEPILCLEVRLVNLLYLVNTIKNIIISNKAVKRLKMGTYSSLWVSWFVVVGNRTSVLRRVALLALGPLRFILTISSVTSLDLSSSSLSLSATRFLMWAERLLSGSVTFLAILRD